MFRWFALGSVIVVITSAMILANNYNVFLGQDDSVLTPNSFRATWVLMTVSGVFFTLGSLAFVRAMSNSPPMKPIFSWYHVASDELLGSWLFLLACVPFVPYSLIYIVQEDDNKAYYGEPLYTATVVML